jgi:hypothetical protein
MLHFDDGSNVKFAVMIMGTMVEGRVTLRPMTPSCRSCTIPLCKYILQNDIYPHTPALRQTTQLVAVVGAKPWQSFVHATGGLSMYVRDISALSHTTTTTAVTCSLLNDGADRNTRRNWTIHGNAANHDNNDRQTDKQVQSTQGTSRDANNDFDSGYTKASVDNKRTATATTATKSVFLWNL